jgi:anti-anti-sigma regulatory factor
VAKNKKTSGDDTQHRLHEGGNGGAVPAKPPGISRRAGKRQAEVSAKTAAQPEQVAVAAEAPADHGTGTADSTPIILDAIITIAEAAALKDHLLAYVNQRGEINIDGSRVESVDTAGLQVLLAFVRTIRAQGTVIRWTGISGALLNTAQLMGVAKLINLQA